MNSDKLNKHLKEYLEMEFTINSELRETTATSVKLITFEEFVENIFSFDDRNSSFSPPRTFDYTVEKSRVTVDNSMGGFLLHFIQANFAKVEGFSKFVKRWGISGLMDINPLFDFPLISEGRHFSSLEVEELYLNYFKGTYTHLLEAQSEFKEVIDYCTDVTVRSFLESLNPLQRYYVGSLKKEIPSLEKYSGLHRAVYNINPRDQDQDQYQYQSNDILDSSIPTEQLASAVAKKDITLNITYYSNDFRTFVYFEFFTLINELLLKKCSNCGNYFIAKHKINEIYCENCRNVSYSEKIKKDPLQKAYHTAYKTRHREKQRKIQESPDNKLWIEQWDGLLKIWIIYAKEQLELARDEKITYEQFIRSLNVTLSELGGV